MRSICLVAILACGRSGGVPDDKLGGLVVEAKPADTGIDVDRAASDPAVLSRALTLPHTAVIAALATHTTTIDSRTVVDEAGKATVSDLSDHTVIELGERGAYHALYTNSADYGREAIFTGGLLYLRPRYQVWHRRTPEAPDEPATLRDQYYAVIAASWDLLAPGAELTDRGPTTVAGRPGRKIEVKLSPSPRRPSPEPLTQRKWRETRSVDALDGEVILDADKGVPLAVKLAGTVGFTRDGRRFAMKLTLEAAVSALDKVATIAVPAAPDVVATPERLKEVDERDQLLHGIAPPLKKGNDAAPPPAIKGDAKPADPSSTAKTKKSSDDTDKPKKKKRKKPADDADAKPPSEKESSP